ncbi:two-component regulator propeller domain-containing protein [Salinivibrio costicola]|uniref:two-component regulator propeller domain-containing protein n=1 Tax=Salinivibrio costicola TaxID=51367 RepID=UPI003F70E75B
MHPRNVQKLFPTRLAQRLVCTVLFCWLGFTPLGYADDNPLSDYFIETWTTANGLPHNSINAIEQTSDGYLWFATWEGAAYLSFHNLFTKAFYVSSSQDGALLVGSESGAWRYKNERWTPLASALLNQAITMVEQEQAQYVFGFSHEPGYVWMATDRDIVRYRQADGHQALVGRPQGLPIDKFFQIVKGDDQSFWLSSNRGIWRINYDHAHQVADKTRSRIDFEHYDQSDGMLNSQANRGSNPAATKTSRGDIIFATAKGVTSVNPTRLSVTPCPLSCKAYDSIAKT